MVQLLHIDASARRSSFSREVGQIYVAAWRAANPDGTYVHRDLGADPVPHVDEAQTEINEYAAANGMNDFSSIENAVRTPEQKATWQVTRPLVAELLESEVLMIATPMYNFSIPSTLKAWIDRITFPWISLADKKGIVITARGGSYAPGTPRAACEFQETYLRTYFSTLKMSDLTFINTELTLSTVVPFLAQFKDKHEAAYAAAREQAEALGRA